jgi:hypothetical protein
LPTFPVRPAFKDAAEDISLVDIRSASASAQWIDGGAVERLDCGELSITDVPVE